MARRIPPTHNLCRQTQCNHLPYSACVFLVMRTEQSLHEDGSVFYTSEVQSILVSANQVSYNFLIFRDWLLCNIPCLYQRHSPDTSCLPRSA